MASWFPNKEPRNAGKIQIPLFWFLSWLHVFLMRKPGIQEKFKFHCPLTRLFKISIIIRKPGTQEQEKS
jgi:hypothetical protein